MSCPSVFFFSFTGGFVWNFSVRNFVVKLERGEGGVVGACMSVCVGPVSYTDSESLVATVNWIAWPSSSAPATRSSSAAENLSKIRSGLLQNHTNTHVHRYTRTQTRTWSQNTYLSSAKIKNARSRPVLGFSVCHFRVVLCENFVCVIVCVFGEGVCVCACVHVCVCMCMKISDASVSLICSVMRVCACRRVSPI